jgi:hypothetical protein
VNFEPAIRWNVERYRGRSLNEVSHSSRRGAAGASGRRAGRALAFAALVRRFFLGIREFGGQYQSCPVKNRVKSIGYSHPLVFHHQSFP